MKKSELRQLIKEELLNEAKKTKTLIFKVKVYGEQSDIDEAEDAISELLNNNMDEYIMNRGIDVEIK